MIHQEKLLTKQECQDIINYSESLDYWERRESPKGNEVKYKYFVMDISNFELIGDKFLNYIEKNLNYKLSFVTILLLKYVKGDYFGRHIDANNNEKYSHDGIENVNTVLNDTFKGGDFYLDNEKIKTTIGHVYNYKSDTYHEVTEITEGVRYSLLCYVRTRNLINKNNKTLL
jgi:predicted 2-oxoglutarate/Fe(II)-dependent dioxygenase YbiX